MKKKKLKSSKKNKFNKNNLSNGREREQIIDEESLVIEKRVNDKNDKIIDIDSEDNSLESLFKGRERAHDVLDGNESIDFGGHASVMAMDLAEKEIEEDDSIVLIDSRSSEEYAAGHIPRAINIGEDDIEEKAEELIPDKGQRIMVYCQGGRRSMIVCRILEKMGYTNVADVGSITNWTGPLESL